MDNPNCNTKRSKGQHLTYEERVEIEIRLKDGWTPYKIHKHLGCSFNTIKNEYERGKVLLFNGKVERYKASVGQKTYMENRKNSKKNYSCLEVVDFLTSAKKDTEPVVMTLVERKLRMSLWLKVENNTAEAIDNALAELIPQFGDKYREVFKSITGDNGSEFANLSKLESIGIPVYFTHPYTSCEKGTNECHNRMLRRFIPKGKSIDNYSADDIMFFYDKINNFPRKILNYHTPEELFEKQLDIIYAT